MSSFDFHDFFFFFWSSDLLHDYQIFCKVSLKFVKETWRYCIYIYQIGYFLDVHNPAYVFWTCPVIKDRISKMYPKDLNGKLWPYHLSCFINSFLYDPANKAWLFEKFIFELEAFYSFKVTCILVRQVISLQKNGDVISKIYYLILWSPICTPLTLVSASVKMAGISARVTYNSMRVYTPGEFLI